MIEILATSVAQTHAFAAKLAQGLAEAVAAGNPESVLVALNGPLGAGKTELVRGFMAGLDPARQQDVSSPTYAIVNIYEGTPVVRHMDLYRLLHTGGNIDHYAQKVMFFLSYILNLCLIFLSLVVCKYWI